ncbi:RagB/SusD family nutrient uptake outer membrane protein [Paraflavitalea pollutisoli]|uniref:RagB/SusD family nutrient uptake outer membrane protein n=1 Tax=Paraflavitalea pollutisoli TaxID=3034143 RepID=UPI0023EE0F6B|nr:RagB/SusD family nutrient uptake outer membrane protein [Paraflavitalea sp. H1-2-19X]
MRMKYSFNLNRTCCLVILMVSMSAGSCKKYLSPQPISSFDVGIVFSNEVNAKAALMGAYMAMAGDPGYGLFTSYQYVYDDDAILGGGAGLDVARRQQAHYTLNASNADILSTYNQLYQGIERANNCIYYLPRMKQYQEGQTAGELRRMHGEALVLRAQYYFELTRIFGDLPEQRVPTAFINTPFQGRTHRDSILTHAIADLEEAKALLPWRTAVAQDERFTKGTAMALRARIALFRGGYALRQNGQLERAADYVDYYKMAQAECDSLMKRREQHTLMPTYRAMFKDVINAHVAVDPQGELMMQVATALGTNSSDSRIGIASGTRMNGVGGPFGPALPTYFYLFDSTDVRRDVTLVPFQIVLDVYGRGNASHSIYDGKFRRDWVSNPSFYFSSGATTGTNPVTLTPASNASLTTMQLNWPLIRFSDVLLMYAEADNELNSAPSAKAIDAFREVSQRGHGGDASLVPAIPTDKEGFFKLLVKERALEFGGEGIRKYDLIRWNLLGTALTETKANLVRMAAGTAMQPYSYMAAPPAYTLTASLPRLMYFYSRVNGVETGKIWANSFYKASPASGSGLRDNTITPNIADITLPNSGANVNRVAWVANASITTTFVNFYGYGFQSGKSELYPLPQAAMEANYNLRPQNPQY